MKLYTMFGSHTAIYTGICSAKAEEIVWKRMYEKLNPKPIPSDKPIPPFVFFEESDAPIIVRINAANDIAMRL